MKIYILSIMMLFLTSSGHISAQSIGGDVFQQNTNIDPLVSAYPNPAKDYLYLKTNHPNLKIKNLVFYSILGNVVANMVVNASYSEIKIDKLKTGKYLMHYTLSDGTQKVIQIIKQ